MSWFDVMKEYCSGGSCGLRCFLRSVSGVMLVEITHNDIQTPAQDKRNEAIHPKTIEETPTNAMLDPVPLSKGASYPPSTQQTYIPPLQTPPFPSLHRSLFLALPTRPSLPNSNHSRSSTLLPILLETPNAVIPTSLSLALPPLLPLLLLGGDEGVEFMLLAAGQVDWGRLFLRDGFGDEDVFYRGA